MNELPITNRETNSDRRGFDSKSLLWGDLERGVEEGQPARRSSVLSGPTDLSASEVGTTSSRTIRNPSV